MIQVLLSILRESWMVFGEMAPFLLFGFLMAGVLKVFLPTAWVEKHLGGKGVAPVAKASIFGVPLPLCSCSVIPVSTSLRRSGASKAATTSFLLSTPQTGVDSIAVTYSLLGPVYAVFRPLVAFITGLVGGLLVLASGENGDGKAGETAADLDVVAGCGCPHDENELHETEAVASCGCGETSTLDDCCCEDEIAEEEQHYLEHEEDGDGCIHCHDKQPAVMGKSPLKQRLGRMFEYGFITLPVDIGVTLLVGVLIAGAMSALLPANSLQPYLGGGILSILLLMAAGVPIYVCATASVPIAASFIHLGASPGAALAFLIAGPATNAATITTLWKILGKWSAMIYLFTVAASAIAFGLLLNAMFPVDRLLLPPLGSHDETHTVSGVFNNVYAVLLLAVFIYAYLSSRLRRAG